MVRWGERVKLILISSVSEQAIKSYKEKKPRNSFQVNILSAQSVKSAIPVTSWLCPFSREGTHRAGWWCTSGKSLPYQYQSTDTAGQLPQSPGREPAHLPELKTWSLTHFSPSNRKSERCHWKVSWQHSFTATEQGHEQQGGTLDCQISNNFAFRTVLQFFVNEHPAVRHRKDPSSLTAYI